MNFYDQALILTYGSVAALLCIVAWDLHAKRRLRLVAVRRKALDDAYDALASAEDIAGRAVDNMLNEPPSPSRDSHIERCKQRAYFYGRAKSFWRRSLWTDCKVCDITRRPDRPSRPDEGTRGSLLRVQHRRLRHLGQEGYCAGGDPRHAAVGPQGD